MTICIYHGNCADGFGAAWVVRKALNEQVFFHGATYQETPPCVTGEDVVMVDFSYKRPVLLEMAALAETILIIDHHKTAQEDLVDLPSNVSTVFDMSRSGAMLTWEHYFPFQPAPQLLKHIEDRDLWKFALPGTREIQAALFSYPYDFIVWDTFMALDDDLDRLHCEGAAIERKHFKDIRELLKVTTREMSIGGHRVPVANLPYTFSSDAGHDLAKGAPFGACYWDTPEGRVFSLRSNADGLDVSEIAKHYGGGGHRNAARFRVGFDMARVMEGEKP